MSAREPAAGPPSPAAPARPQAPVFVGVDVGGTKISLAALREGALGTPTVEPTERSRQEALVDQIASGVQRAIAAAARGGESARVAAVGVGIPSVIEFETGTVRASVNVPLRDVPLRAVLEERLGLRVYVDNDATCAAIAEAHDAHGRLDTPNLVMLTVGTGVGGGLVIGGLPYRGATGAAGELGHTIVGLDLSASALAGDAPDGFPRPGSLESLASGRALDALARDVATQSPGSALGRLALGGAAVAGPDAVRLAQAGDADARAALRLLGERLGVGVANAINTFDPDVVAIGGGVSAAGALLLEPAIASARRFVLPGVGTRTEVRIARSGPQAGVRGAALLAAIEHTRADERSPAARRREA